LSTVRTGDIGVVPALWMASHRKRGCSWISKAPRRDTHRVGLARTVSRGVRVAGTSPVDPFTETTQRRTALVQLSSLRKRFFELTRCP
jgi:hypothetical protein